ncbi:MAG: hypothetical protein WDN49_01345 [Acetobacteraceae bacterium]
MNAVLSMAPEEKRFDLMMIDQYTRRTRSANAAVSAWTARCIKTSILPPQDNSEKVQSRLRLMAKSALKFGNNFVNVDEISFWIIFDAEFRHITQASSWGLPPRMMGAWDRKAKALPWNRQRPRAFGNQYFSRGANRRQMVLDLMRG